MSEVEFRVHTEGICESEAFAEASREELRALVAIIEAEGRIGSAESLAKMAGISTPRATAAISLWQEAGVISDEKKILDEFDSSILSRRVEESSSERVAKSIRDSGLKTLIAEVAALMDRPTLSTQEIKHVTALVTELALSEEYVLTLAAYLAEKGKLTAHNLSRKAEMLHAKNIDNVEELERHVANESTEIRLAKEFQSAFALRRLPSKTELKYFRRWTEEFGFATPVILECYDCAVLGTGGSWSLPYMDKIITAWHEAGCKTVEECRAKFEADRPLIKARGRKKKKESEDSNSPKYTNFDAEDALMRALERSYGKSAEEEKK